MSIIKRYLLILFLCSLIGFSSVFASETTASGAMNTESSTSKDTAYVGGTLLIILSIGIGYGLKKVYDYSREEFKRRT